MWSCTADYANSGAPPQKYLKAFIHRFFVLLGIHILEHRHETLDPIIIAARPTGQRIICTLIIYYFISKYFNTVSKEIQNIYACRSNMCPYAITLQHKFDDMKWVIRIRKSKDRHH